MKMLRIAPAAFLVFALGACSGDLLDLHPVDQIDESTAITNAATAQDALYGAYSALEDGNYYGGDYFLYGDLMADNSEHTGTFQTYAQADRHQLLPENVTLDGIWTAIYRGIYRVNILIEKVPQLEGVDAAVADGILAQAYALRALHYFNLVRAWGDVPLILAPLSLDEAAQVARTPVADVYAQILDDLGTAEQLFQTAGAANDDRTSTTPGFVDAMQAKVNLYLGNWAAAQSNALELVNSGDYGLAPVYSSLFPPDLPQTNESVFQVTFTASDFNNYGFYYQFAGRFEVGATQSIYNAYSPDDARFAWDFGAVDGNDIEVTKFPTTTGTEDFYAMRYAEVLLTLAESLARQGELRTWLWPFST